VRQEVTVPIGGRAPDLDLLLFEWLDSLVHHMSTQHLAAGVAGRAGLSRLEPLICVKG